MSGNQEKGIQALEHSYSATISPEIRACAERLAAEEGIQADELIAEAEWLMVTAGPPYNVERVAAMTAGERGTSMADVLSEARARL
ncbi:MAG: hypothetical protein ACR2OE_00360 [Thermomicrobiales bacterium]